MAHGATSLDWFACELASLQQQYNSSLLFIQTSQGIWGIVISTHPVLHPRHIHGSRPSLRLLIINEPPLLPLRSEHGDKTRRSITLLCRLLSCVCVCVVGSFYDNNSRTDIYTRSRTLRRDTVYRWSVGIVRGLESWSSFFSSGPVVLPVLG